MCDGNGQHWQVLAEPERGKVFGSEHSSQPPSEEPQDAGLAENHGNAAAARHSSITGSGRQEVACPVLATLAGLADQLSACMISNIIAATLSVFMFTTKLPRAGH